MDSLKKVLIITYYWPPAGGPGVQRVLKFVKYLGDFGFEAIVLTVKDGDYVAIDESLANDISEDVSVYKTNILEPHRLYKVLKGMKAEDKISTTVLTDKENSIIDKISKWIRLNLFIPDARVMWLFSLKKTFREIKENHKIDIILSSGPPHTCHIAASKASKFFSVPFITDFRDPWTNFVSYQSQKRFFLSHFIDSKLESYINHNSHACIVVSNEMKNDLLIKDTTKISVIPNGYDEDDIQTTPLKHDEFLFTYTGSLDKNRIPVPLLYASKELLPSIPIKFRFIGRICSELKNLVDELGLTDNTEYIGYLPHNEVINYLYESFSLILTIDNVPNNKGFLTGKIFEYIGASRPIFAIGPPNGDAAKIIEESQSGKMLGYNDIDGAKDYLLNLYDLFREKKEFCNKKDKYTRRNNTKELSEVLRRLC